MRRGALHTGTATCAIPETLKRYCLLTKCLKTERGECTVLYVVDSVNHQQRDLPGIKFNTRTDLR